MEAGCVVDALASVRDDARWIIIVCVAILVAGFLLFAGLWLYGRRYLRSEGESDEAAGAWTLADLRKLRDQGELTEDEYQAMRSAIIGAYGGAAGGETGESEAGPGDGKSGDRRGF
jgi:hypothetical protein